MARKQAGFTLLEVMLSFLFLSIAIIPIAYLMDSVYSKSFDARATGIGTYLAQRYMEEILAGGYFNIPAPGTYPYATPYATPPKPLDQFPDFTIYSEISKDTDFNPGAVEPHPGSGTSDNFKTVKVVVYWGKGRRGERVELVRVAGNIL